MLVTLAKVGHTNPESFLLRRYGRYWRIDTIMTQTVM